jgi:chromosome segregation ATPase
MISRTRQFAVLLGIGLSMLLSGIACDFASSQEAKEVLQTGREVRKIETEELEPRLAALDRLRNDEIDPREERLEEIDRQIRDIYRTKIEPLHEQMRRQQPTGDPMREVFREFEGRMQSIMDDEEALEREFRSLDTRFREQQRASQDSLTASARAKEDRMHGLGRQLQTIHRDGRAPIENVHSEVRQLESRLFGLQSDSPDYGPLQAKINDLRNSIGQMEQQLHAQARSMEDEMNALSNELRQMYRTMDDQMRAMQAAAEAEMKKLEDRRFALNDRRRELEIAMRDRMMTFQTEEDGKRRQIEQQVKQIEETEIAPLEDAAGKLEVELRTLRAQEKTLTTELRRIRDSVQAKEGQLEDRLLALLERAINATPAASGDQAAPVSAAAP